MLDRSARSLRITANRLHSLPSQRELGSLGRNSISVRSFHRYGGHDQKSRAARSAAYLVRESLFQHSYPCPEFKIVGSTDKKMNVIGHDYISTNSDIMLRMRPRCERYERGVHPLRCKQFPPSLRAECDEEEGIVRKYPSQPWRNFGIFAHASLVAASLWEAQCRYSLPHATSPTGRRLQEPHFDALACAVSAQPEFWH